MFLWWETWTPGWKQLMHCVEMLVLRTLFIRFGQNPSLPKATFIGTSDLKKVSMETQTYCTTCSKLHTSFTTLVTNVPNTDILHIYQKIRMCTLINSYRSWVFLKTKPLLFSGVMYSMQDRACTIDLNDTLSILCL